MKKKTSRKQTLIEKLVARHAAKRGGRRQAGRRVGSRQAKYPPRPLHQSKSAFTRDQSVMMRQLEKLKSRDKEQIQAVIKERQAAKKERKRANQAEKQAKRVQDNLVSLENAKKVLQERVKNKEFKDKQLLKTQENARANKDKKTQAQIDRENQKEQRAKEKQERELKLKEDKLRILKEGQDKIARERKEEADRKAAEKQKRQDEEMQKKIDKENKRIAEQHAKEMEKLQKQQEAAIAKAEKGGAAMSQEKQDELDKKRQEAERKKKEKEDQMQAEFLTKKELNRISREVEEKQRLEQQREEFENKMEVETVKDIAKAEKVNQMDTDKSTEPKENFLQRQQRELQEQFSGASEDGPLDTPEKEHEDLVDKISNDPALMSAPDQWSGQSDDEVSASDEEQVDLASANESQFSSEDDSEPELVEGQGSVELDVRDPTSENDSDFESVDEDSSTDDEILVNKKRGADSDNDDAEESTQQSKRTKEDDSQALVPFVPKPAQQTMSDSESESESEDDMTAQAPAPEPSPKPTPDRITPIITDIGPIPTDAELDRAADDTPSKPELPEKEKREYALATRRGGVPTGQEDDDPVPSPEKRTRDNDPSLPTPSTSGPLAIMPRPDSRSFPLEQDFEQPNKRTKEGTRNSDTDLSMTDEK